MCCIYYWHNSLFAPKLFKQCKQCKQFDGGSSVIYFVYSKAFQINKCVGWYTEVHNVQSAFFSFLGFDAVQKICLHLSLTHNQIYQPTVTHNFRKKSLAKVALAGSEYWITNNAMVHSQKICRFCTIWYISLSKEKFRGCSSLSCLAVHRLQSYKVLSGSWETGEV